MLAKTLTILRDIPCLTRSSAIPRRLFRRQIIFPRVIGIKGYFISFIHREFIGFQLTKSSVKIEAGRGRTLVNRAVVNDSYSSWSVFQFLTLRSFPDISKPGIRTQFLFYASMKKINDSESSIYVIASVKGLSLCLRDRILRVQSSDNEKKEEKHNSSQSSLAISSGLAVLWLGPYLI